MVNYHGKIVPADRCELVIKSIEKKLNNKDQGLRLCWPKLPVMDDALPARNEPIRLSAKPAYRIGEIVSIFPSF